MSHTKLVNECCEELALRGVFAWPNNTGAGTIDGRFIRYGKLGSGDIIAVMPPNGRHTEFECKTGKAVQKKHQKIHMRKVLESGGEYHIIRSRDQLAALLSERDIARI